MKVETKGELRRIIKVSSERIADLEAMLLGALQENTKLKTRFVVSIVANLLLGLLVALKFGIFSL